MTPAGTWLAMVGLAVLVAGLLLLAVAPGVLPDPWADMARRARSGLVALAAALGGVLVGLALRNRSSGVSGTPGGSPAPPPMVDRNDPRRIELDTEAEILDEQIETDPDLASRHLSQRERFRRGDG